MQEELFNIILRWLDGDYFGIPKDTINTAIIDALRNEKVPDYDKKMDLLRSIQSQNAMDKKE